MFFSFIQQTMIVLTVTKHANYEIVFLRLIYLSVADATPRDENKLV